MIVFYFKHRFLKVITMTVILVGSIFGNYGEFTYKV